MLIKRTSTTSNKIKKCFMEIITFNFFIKTNEDILRSYQNNGFYNYEQPHFISGDM